MFIHQNSHLLKLILTNEFSLHVIKVSFKVLYFICNDVQIYRFKYWVPIVLEYFRNLRDVSVHNLETHSLTVSWSWISSPLRPMIFPNHIYRLFRVPPQFIIFVALNDKYFYMTKVSSSYFWKIFFVSFEIILNFV